MYITSIAEQPIYEIPFLTATSNGVGVNILPIVIAEVDFLPDGLEAIIATSDLQGIDLHQRLIGNFVAEELEKLAELGKIPPSDKTGVILAGDFYAGINKRGGVGDVREVWQAFSKRFSFCVGVAGNHDSFGETAEDIKEFQQARGIYYLDGDITNIDGISIAGISGIIGNKNKPFRRPEKEFMKVINQLIQYSPDILVLHEGPNNPSIKLKGNNSIRIGLLEANNLLVICGHSHWKTPITSISSNVQVLNTDNRIVILLRVC
jgi:Icc-related predicted phosphoesterase